ncbi:MAG: DNA polymerase III subunit [Clostridia bacterium]|nr:DNA polymerase III subunit [Clostridia bacterium]
MFDNIVGNKAAKKTLKKAVELNKVSHSYMFVGISGIGKRLIAKEFAKMLLCLDDNKYCNKCKSCLEFDSSNNPDYIYIEPDEKGSIKIDQIRNMQKEVSEKPIISSNKVCIINDADMMTVEAQNCLLKTLEEPPTYMTIVLIGTNESNFLATIKSRCTIMYFERISDEEITSFLSENFQGQTIGSNITEIADGSIAKAINLKDKTGTYEKITNIIDNLENCDIIHILKEAENLYKEKDEIFEILDYMNVLLIKKAINSSKYANCIEIIEETKKRIKSNSNYNMCIDYMLFGIWGEVNEKHSRSKI